MGLGMAAGPSTQRHTLLLYDDGHSQCAHALPRDRMPVAAVEPKAQSAEDSERTLEKCDAESRASTFRSRHKKGCTKGLLPMRGALHYSANGTREVILLEHIHSANVAMQGGVGAEGGTGVG